MTKLSWAFQGYEFAAHDRKVTLFEPQSGWIQDE